MLLYQINDLVAYIFFSGYELGILNIASNQELKTGGKSVSARVAPFCFVLQFGEGNCIAFENNCCEILNHVISVLGFN